MRADRTGFAGYARARTPSLDALAARGTVFTSAWTPVPDASPALASLMTGLPPDRHGVAVSGSGALPDDLATLAEAVSGAGVRTAAVAASLSLHPRHGFGQGFERYESPFSEVARPSQLPPTGATAMQAATKALEILEPLRAERFFLWVSFFDPHAPYMPPSNLGDGMQDAPYDGEIAFVDRELGRLLKKLADYGREADTLVIVAGTNGESLGEGGEETHGTLLHEATLRVPLVVAGPGFPAGRRDEPVSLMDLHPTILGALGLEAPGGGTPGAGAPGAVSLSGSLPGDRTIAAVAPMPDRLFGWIAPRATISRAGVRAEPRGAAEGAGVAPPAIAQVPPAARAAIEAAGYAADPAARTPVDPGGAAAAASDALRGHRQFRMNNLQAAAFLHDGVLDRDPDNHLALLESALLRGRQEPAEAWRRLVRARDLYPASSEVYHQMGHFAGAHPERAASSGEAVLFGIATLLDPLNEEAHYDLACSLAVEGKRDEALQALDRAVKGGFRDFSWMASDGDLDSIRGDARFEAITLGKAKKPASPDAAAAPAGAAPR